MNVIEEIEKEQLAKLTAARPVPEFAPGDPVRVNVKVVEGTRERIQAFEGVCIARKNGGLNSAFTVRKISYGEGVERVFPLYSTIISSIDVIRRGAVRRAKLYYLRERSGKSARIAEKVVSPAAKLAAQQAAAAAKKDKKDKKAKAVQAAAPDTATASNAAEANATPVDKPKKKKSAKKKEST